MGAAGGVPLSFEGFCLAFCGGKSLPRLAESHLKVTELLGRLGRILLGPRDHGIRSAARAEQFRVGVVDRVWAGALGRRTLPGCAGARVGERNGLREVDRFEPDRLKWSQ